MPIPLTMPALSPTMTHGTLSKWLIEEGGMVAPGDVIAEIETDKATMEVESADDGILAKILVPGGTQGVAVGTIIGILAQEGEVVSSIQSPVSSIQSPVSSLQKPENGIKKDPKKPSSPLARKVAQSHGLDIENISGTGPHGRVIKRDVEAACVTPQNVPMTHFDTDRARAQTVPHSTMRRVIAERLSESKATIPHFYLEADCVLEALLTARTSVNEAGKGIYKVSVNDFIVKAAASALMAVPDAHVVWGPEALSCFKSADIAIAVATPGGLITPIIRDVQDKGLAVIAKEIKDLAARAREGLLRPQEFQGGNFTISNLGMYGVRAFSAIINPPQAMILAVGAGESRVIVEEGAPVVRTVMTVTLSVDHRAIDGAVAAQWLYAFKNYIQNPTLMLI